MAGDPINDQVKAPVATPPPDVNPGDTSEAMFHRLDALKEKMSHDRLGFLYDRWHNHPCADPGRKGKWAGQPMWGQGWQEQEGGPQHGLFQLKVINFGLIWDARGRFNNLHTAAQGVAAVSDQLFQSLHAAWTSKAGDAAAAKFTDLKNAAQAYADQVQILCAQADGTWHTARAAVEKLAGFADGPEGKPMMDNYGEGKSDDDGNESRGQWSRRIDEMNAALEHGIYDKEACTDDDDKGDEDWFPGTPDRLRAADQCELTDGDNMWSDQACKWLDDMCERYFLTVSAFRRQVEETIRTVGEAYDNMNAATSKVHADAFDKLTLGADPGGNNGKDHDQGGNGKDQDPGGGGKKHTGGTDTSGVDTGGGSHTQQPPPPPIKGPDDHNGTQPSDTGGGTVQPPGTGPGQHQQQPPGGGHQAQPGQQESVTIQAGDQKITVDSPDGQGHVKLTVDDGSGKPKTYDVDFSGGTGTGTSADPTGAGQGPGQGQYGPGQTGQGQYGPGQNGQGQDGQGFGPTGQDPTHQQGQGFGPTGQDPDQAHTLPAPDGQGAPGGGDGQVQHAVAGPDGKAVIHDGNVTITAEQPPGSDQVKITVDDGAGHTSTYLVDYDDPSNPQVQHGGPTQQAQADGFAGTGGQHAAATGGAGFAGGGDTGGQHAAATGGAHAGQADGFVGSDTGGGHAEQAQPASYAPTDQVQQSAPATGQVWSEPQEQPLATHTQSAFTFDGADANAADGAWSTQGDLLDGHADQQPEHQQVAPAAGEAGLATVPDGQSHNPQQGAGSPMGGGMPMMGAMGGAGGGGGGDQERGPSTWSTTGDLFDEGPRVAAEQISNVLDGNGG